MQDDLMTPDRHDDLLDRLELGMSELGTAVRTNLRQLVWARTESVLDTLYKIEEFAAEAPGGKPHYRDVRQSSREGHAMGGLVWVRGLVTHHALVIDEPRAGYETEIVELSAGGWVLIPGSEKSHPAALVWRSLADLPKADPKYKPYGRDVMYHDTVAGELLTDPLEAARRFVRRRQWLESRPLHK